MKTYRAEFTKEELIELLMEQKEHSDDRDINYLILNFIKNIDDDLKLFMVKEHGELLEFIKNPTEEMKLLAVKSHGLVIDYIENPTEEMKLEAVKQNGYSIQYIENPTEDMKLAAVKSNPSSISYIKDPTLEMQLIIMRDNIRNIVFLKDPICKEIICYLAEHGESYKSHQSDYPTIIYYLRNNKDFASCEDKINFLSANDNYQYEKYLRYKDCKDLIE